MFLRELIGVCKLVIWTNMVAITRSRTRTTTDSVGDWLKFAFGQDWSPPDTHTYHLCSYFRSEKTLICQVKLVRFRRFSNKFGAQVRHYRAANRSVYQSIKRAINQSITATERHSRGTSDRYISWRYSARARKITMLQECRVTERFIYENSQDNGLK